MKFYFFIPSLICLLFVVPSCSDPEESERLAREKYDTLKEMTTPVIEREKTDGQSFIDGFMKEKDE